MWGLTPNQINITETAVASPPRSFTRSAFPAFPAFSEVQALAVPQFKQVSLCLSVSEAPFTSLQRRETDKEMAD